MHQFRLFFSLILCSVLILSCEPENPELPGNPNTSDEIPPTFTSCPASQEVLTDHLGNYTMADFMESVGALDNFNPVEDLIIEQVPLPGTAIVINSDTTVSVIIIDTSGNSDTCSFILNAVVQDITAPSIINCPQNMFMAPDDNGEVILGDFTHQIVVSDDLTPDSIIVLTQLPSAGTTIQGEGTVQLVTISAVDLSGNFSICTFTITLEEDTPPMITSCASDTLLEVSSDCFLVVPDFTGDIVVIDMESSSDEISITQSPSPGSAIIGTNTIQLTATDPAGNIAVCSFVLTAIDLSPPDLNCPDTLTLAGMGTTEADMPDVWDTIVFTDNCSAGTDLSYTQSPSQGSLVTDGDMVSVTVVDSSGNQTSCSFPISVEP